MIKSSIIGIIISELFQISLITYLLLLLLETIDKGFVSNFFNMNLLLGVVLVSGIIKVLPISEKRHLDQWDIIDLGINKLYEQLKIKGISENEFYFIILVGLGGGFLVYLKTQELGKISLVIGAITMIIIFLLSYLIFTDQESEETN